MSAPGGQEGRKEKERIGWRKGGGRGLQDRMGWKADGELADPATLILDTRE